MCNHTSLTCNMGSSSDLYDELIPFIEIPVNSLAAPSNFSTTPRGNNNAERYTTLTSSHSQHDAALLDEKFLPLASVNKRFIMAPTDFSQSYSNHLSGIGSSTLNYDEAKDPVMYCLPAALVLHSQDQQKHHLQHKARNTTSTSRANRRNKPSPNNPGYTAKHHLRHFVVHNYHDRCGDASNVFKETYTELTTARGGVVTPFPTILHNMLERIEDEGLSHVVSWSPHGRAFAVHNPKAFINKVMPLFFRQSKISSFQRQLNLYGFVRLTRNGSDKGAYYHEYFLRGRPDLSSQLQRTRVKGTGVRTSSNPQTEPNFYKMSSVPLPANNDGGKSMDLLVLSAASVSAGFPISRELRHDSSFCQNMTVSQISTKGSTADDLPHPYHVFSSTHSQPKLWYDMPTSNLLPSSGSQSGSQESNPFLTSPDEAWHSQDSDFCFCDIKRVGPYADITSFGSDNDLDEVEFGRILEEILD